MNGEQMFERGADALKKFEVKIKTYVCPICTSRYYSYDPKILTLEHVPAEKLGGNKLLLTCKDCNNQAGSKLQSHQIQKEKQERFWLQDLDEHINLELKTNSGILRGVVQGKKTNPPTFKIDNNRIDPKTLDGFKLEELKKPIVHKLGKPFDWHTSRIADLRDAYLIIFTKFGYSFVGWKFYDWIRKSIMNGKSPKEKYKWSLHMNDPFSKNIQKRYGSPVILLTDKPKNALIVVRGTSGCLMPTPSCPDPYKDFGKNKASISLNTQKIFLMPKKMELSWDFDSTVIVKKESN